MAEYKNRISENLNGQYYVDDQCIACDACVMESPDFFIMNDIEGYAFVKKQPRDLAEVEACENALIACPVEAIGSDGPTCV